MERKDFIKGSTIAAASLGFWGILTPEQKNNMKNLFIHHVYFWLKEPDNAEAVKKFEAALKNLVTIDSIYQHHLGKPADTNREVIDSSYNYSLLVIFKNKEDHDIYQAHPVHDEFRKVNDQLSKKVLVYDTVDM